MCEAVGGLAEIARPFRDFTTVFLLFWNFLLNALYKSALFYMTRSWRVPMIVTSHFPTYESIILSKNLNNKKKLTGWVTPTVQWVFMNVSQNIWSFDTPDTPGCSSTVIWNRFEPFLLHCDQWPFVALQLWLRDEFGISMMASSKQSLFSLSY